MPEKAEAPWSIYLAGPTASGKSSVAMVLAERLGGEIISMDSMQVYRGMDIGTAKPGAEERDRVRHHLIDVVSVSERFDVARFLKLAEEATREILGRGKVPIYCGGTGLYFKALIAGIGTAPASNPEVRKELENTPIEILLKELEKGDPATFRVIDKKNRRRVIRAVEVIRVTERSFAEQKDSWKIEQPPGVWVGLKRERADLCQRIEARVDSMFGQGLVEETKALLKEGLEPGGNATQALGYKQTIEFLNGARDLASTIALVKQKTRQYAKRQMTWFQRQLSLQWIEAGESPDVVASRIMKCLCQG